MLFRLLVQGGAWDHSCTSCQQTNTDVPSSGLKEQPDNPCTTSNPGPPAPDNKQIGSESPSFKHFLAKAG